MWHKQESSPHKSLGRREFAVIDFVVKRAHCAVVSLTKNKKRVRLHSEKPHVLPAVLALEKTAVRTCEDFRQHVLMPSFFSVACEG